MRDEFAARQRAISLRLGGRPVQSICQALGRSEFWFHKWWRRYLESGAEGLYDLTHATHHVAQRISPELERTILSVRRRLQAHASPATRYRLIGAPAILAELQALDIHPLPHPRTIERVLERNGLTAPRIRLAPCCRARSGPDRRPAPPMNSTRSISWDPSTSGATATATTSGPAKMPSMAPFACAWPVRAAWTRFSGSSASAGRIWACRSRSSSTMLANWPVGASRRGRCRA